MIIRNYWKNLYRRTMDLAYEKAYNEIGSAIIKSDSRILDCGAYNGKSYFVFKERVGLPPERYHGIEWSTQEVHTAKERGLNVEQGDLNDPLPLEDESVSVCYGLSVLEHLVRPCRWMRESYRILEQGGTFVVLTPNIANYFTAAQILWGRMPSSGPYPDSSYLVNKKMVMNVSNKTADVEDENPVHRHHIIFSYKTLQLYLRHIGFRSVTGYGFGVYPFPEFLQPLFEKIDKIHCHQMVFVCHK